MHKKKIRRLNRYGKWLFFSVLVLLVVVVFFFFFSKKQQSEVHEVIQKKNYHMKINYPITRIKAIDQEVKKYVTSKKEEFLGLVKKQKETGEDFQYEFLTQYEKLEHGDCLFLHLKIEAYTGGAHYTREDKTIVYQRKEKKKLEFEDLLENKEAFSKIANMVYYEVMEQGKGREVPYEDAVVKEGTKADRENYQHFFLEEQGLTILFPPYQVASWADGEVKVTLPYEKVNVFLKKAFRGKEEPTENPSSSTPPEKRDLSAYKGKKLIAFTFDDGPGMPTRNLLDGLKERDARVTFFVLGSRVDPYRNFIKRAYEEGHQIGSHTYNHKNLFLLNDFEIMHEVNDTNEAVKKVIGVSPTLLRPPYGNLKKESRSYINMDIILWDIDPEDWKIHDKNQIANEIVAAAHDGAIVLLHDIYQSSVDGALLAMDYLKSEYAFVTIEEMAELKGITLDPTKSYYEF